MNFPKLNAFWSRLKGRHPAGLYVLSSTEMAERFSFYGMKALLVYYLMKYFNLPEASALQTLAVYSSLVYLATLPGGWITDKFLGQRKAILIGGILMALGHLAMTIDSLLYTALGLIIVGCGFFKPNISTLVGDLYEEGDKRKESAYTIFYMGINLGAFLAPIICGALAGDLDSPDARWHLGFGAATAAMVFSMILFVLMGKTIGDKGYPPSQANSAEKRFGLMEWLHVGGMVLACTVFVAACVWFWPTLAAVWAVIAAKCSALFALIAPYVGMLIEPPFLTGWVLLLYKLALGALLGWLGYKAFCLLLSKQGFSADEVRQIVLIAVLATFGMLFWIIFEQGSGTMAVFADDPSKTDLQSWALSISVPWIGGWTTIELFNNPAFFQAVNPLFILLFAIPFSWFWEKLAEKQIDFSPVAAQGVGLILAGLGALLMAIADYRAVSIGPVLPIWLIGVYLLFTLGELLISPVGLALVNRLSPQRAASLLMAVWLGSTAIANYLAHTLKERLHESGSFERVLEQAAAYMPASLSDVMVRSEPLWFFLALLGFVSGGLVLLITPKLRKLSCGKC